jgi:sigma-B regulation protein RsbU (phosphoserine phosphatase)
MEHEQTDSLLTQYAITVLLVDDQPIVGDAVKRMLAPESDIVFHYCSDPTQALQTALEISPTIILQDLVMPEIDGITLVKFFRANAKLRDIPLIVLSTKEEPTTKAEAFAVGANDYLVKLPDRIELIARIRYHSSSYINLLQRNEAYAALQKSQKVLADDIARASEYIESLLPELLTGEISSHYKYIPSTQLGGDSFGYHWIDERHFAMYLLDVCGHGVGPALLSVSALNMLRSQTLPGTDFLQPDQVLSALNASFQMSNQNNMYFTIWYGVYDRDTRELSYASGGHPPSLLFSADASARQISTPNFIIGGLPSFPYSSASTQVGPGSDLYIFSDGVYEVFKTKDEMWTLEELQEYLGAHKNSNADEIDSLYTFLQGMHGHEQLDDDFSMLKISFS